MSEWNINLYQFKALNNKSTNGGKYTGAWRRVRITPGKANSFIANHDCIRAANTTEAEDTAGLPIIIHYNLFLLFFVSFASFFEKKNST